MDNTKEQRIISFCTGYGGIELGIKRVEPSIRTICYVEIEAFAIANLVAKIEEGKMDAAPIWTDIKTFVGRPFCGKVHGIIGGYPCQPFSCAGQRKGTEDPRHLWPYIEEHIRTIRPVWCFFENVFGHLSKGFDIVVKSLQNLGYAVEAGIFSAEEVGLPHQRKRLFILAVSKGSRFRRGENRNRADGERFQEQKENERPMVRSKTEGCCGNTRGKEELGNTTSQGLQKQQENRQPQPIQNAERRSEEELGNPKSIGSQGLQEQGQRGRKFNASSELAYSNEPGSQGWNSGELPECSCELSTGEGCTRQRAVARPGELQYDWEEPRTVERLLGGATVRNTGRLDSTTNRVDRLRLCGNGVVPATAELAFRTLWNKMSENHDTRS